MVPTLAITIASVLFLTTSAVRRNTVDLDFAAEHSGPAAEKMHAIFVSAGGSLCGGPDIQKMIGGDSSVQRVRNLPWAKVLAIADNYIAAQNSKVDVLQVELKNLKEALEKARLAEIPRAMTDEEIKAAVKAAVSSPTSFGSVDQAKLTKCGAVLPKSRAERPPADAYDVAVEAVVGALQPLLGSGTVSPGDSFSAVCGEFLGSGPDDIENFCGEMCQALADRAAGMAGDVVAGGVGTSSADLALQAEEKERQLKVALSGLSECQTAKGTLEAFQKELGGLATVIKDEFAKVMAARQALRGAEDDLGEIDADLADQDKVLQSLQAILTGTGAELATAQTLVQELTAANAATTAAIQSTEAELQQASAQVKRASDASTAAQELRAQLSSLLLKIASYIDVAVRNPIRDLGLGETVPIAKYFQKDGAVQGEADATGKAVVALESFCQKANTARAFSEMEGAIPESPSLCQLGAPSAEITQEISGAVDLRVSKVSEELVKLQSWLNPFKGQQEDTKDKLAGYVAAGEPEGLRAVIAIMDQSHFYTAYLKHWKATDKFAVLFNGLGDAVKESEAKHAQVQEALTKLQSQLQAGIDKRNQALAALKAAMETDQIAKENMAVAQQEYDALAGQQKLLEDKLAKLKAAAEAAQKAYEEAQRNLEQTHRQGTALLELLREIQEAHEAVSSAW